LVVFGFGETLVEAEVFVHARIQVSQTERAGYRSEKEEEGEEEQKEQEEWKRREKEEQRKSGREEVEEAEEGRRDCSPCPLGNTCWSRDCDSVISCLARQSK
jgi:hypothetical protein